MPLPTGAETADVPVPTALTVATPIALVDFKVRLLDELDRLVGTDDTAHVGAGVRYRIVPREPLVTGTRYRVVVEGQLRPHPTDVAGATFRDAAVTFRTAGEKPPPPPKKKKRRRR